MAASGLPGYESVTITGLFAPAGTPELVVTLLNYETVRFLRLPEVKEQFFNAGLEAIGSSQEQFAAQIRSEAVRMGKVIRSANIRGD